MSSFSWRPIVRAFSSRTRPLTPLVGTGFLQLEDRTVPSFSEFLDPNPNSGNQFGYSVTALSTGNVVITSPYDDAGGIDAGAVYLFSGATGQLISTLRGSSANDRVGLDGVTALPNGNFVVQSSHWNQGGTADVGAVTLGNGVSGVSGTVSTVNSLVGSAPGDLFNASVTVLANGNYVVRSRNWDHGSATDAGAVTWGNGSSGITGIISAANSLVGSYAGDQLGWDPVAVLPNGNYVVPSPHWNNGTGAVTWGNGTTGVTGIISTDKSLVGSSTHDFVGMLSICVVANSNYVIASPLWNNGTGAVTWGSGATGVTGTISVANSLVGPSTGSFVGGYGIYALSNGNFVAASALWDQGRGAVTWGDGTMGITGVVSAANSLVGSTPADHVGSWLQITTLTNGNYVVSSPSWDNGNVVDAGAVTWGNGLGGTTGAVSATNSLVGSSTGDQIGSQRAVALTNGNYVVATATWNNGSIVDAGAVTWGNGLGGTTGAVSSANSLVGTVAYDRVGGSINPDMAPESVVPLVNGNYVVVSRTWRNGYGAVTWGNGLGGTTGGVSSANSLVGVYASDRVGDNDYSASVTPLANGNYVVSSRYDSGGRGAATWGDGTTGVTGYVTYLNSLVGSRPDDAVGLRVTPLANGNYVVASELWDNEGAVDAGAVTWGNGLGGTTGSLSVSNSLLGDRVGGNTPVGLGVIPLSNGNYVIPSAMWNYGTGAVTWGNGTTGLRGIVSDSNSLVGSAPGAGLSSVVLDSVNLNYYAAFLTDGGGRVLVGSQLGNRPRDIVWSPNAVIENQPAGAFVASLSVVDPDLHESFTFALVPGTGDTDNALFTFDGYMLRTNAVLDFESRSTYSVRVRVTDASGLTFEKVLVGSVTNVNEPPTLTGGNTFSIPENVAVVGTFTASDPDFGDRLVFSISGGADSGKFEIDASTGVLRFVTPPDFEHPTDANGDNIYEVTVCVSDGSLTDTRSVSVFVTDVNEATLPRLFVVRQGDGTLAQVDDKSLLVHRFTPPTGYGDYSMNLGADPAGGTIVIGSGVGVSSKVAVLDGTTGALLREWVPFDAGFLGGVNVAAGDVTGDGVADIVVAAGAGGGPHVKVFDGVTGAEVRSFFAFGQGFTGGVSVAVGDLDGDGYADIIVGARSGGGPQVAVFSGRDGSVLASFYAYDISFTGGVRVSAGDIDGDGLADVVTGAGAGGGPNVRVFVGPSVSLFASFLTREDKATEGVRVVVRDVTGDQQAEVVAFTTMTERNETRVYQAASDASFSALSTHDTPRMGLLGGASSLSEVWQDIG